MLFRRDRRGIIIRGISVHFGANLDMEYRNKVKPLNLESHRLERGFGNWFHAVSGFMLGTISEKLGEYS